MITLHIPHHSNNGDDDDNDSSAVKSAVSVSVSVESTAKADEKSPTSAATDNKKNGISNNCYCSCLNLHPEMDANLPQFHPNIYIPSVLLDYPEHLIKYGGGGE